MGKKELRFFWWVPFTLVCTFIATFLALKTYPDPVWTLFIFGTVLLVIIMALLWIYIVRGDCYQKMLLEE